MTNGNYLATHSRKCECCAQLFIATLRDVRGQEFRCPDCRTKQQPETLHGIQRWPGASELWPLLPQWNGGLIKTGGRR